MALHRSLGGERLLLSSLLYAAVAFGFVVLPPSAPGAVWRGLGAALAAALAVVVQHLIGIYQTAMLHYLAPLGRIALRVVVLWSLAWFVVFRLGGVDARRSLLMAAAIGMVRSGLTLVSTVKERRHACPPSMRDARASSTEDIAWYRDELAARPLDFYLVGGLGLQLVFAGEHEAGIQSLRSAVAMAEARRGGALATLGCALYLSGKVEQARLAIADARSQGDFFAFDEVEVVFYEYAFDPDMRSDAAHRLQVFIDRGFGLPELPPEPIIKAAQSQGHPAMGKLREVVDGIRQPRRGVLAYL